MPHICNLPTRFTFVPSSGHWHVEKSAETTQVLLVLTFSDPEVLIAEKKGTFFPDRAALDPWKVRDRFLGLKRSEDDLLRFLNDAGSWDRSLGPFQPQNIWGWQDAINDLLLHPDRGWQDTISQHLNPYAGSMDLGAYLDIAFEFSDKAVWFELMPFGCLGALVGTVLIDRLEGARFKVCRRPDCHRTFRLQSKHKRMYCSYDCAHLQSVRESRRQNRVKRVPRRNG